MRYSVDGICVHKRSKKFVIIKRLSFPFGLALPGGGIEDDESKDLAIIREVKEETGFDFTITGWLPDPWEIKDPRWKVITQIAYGECDGKMENEIGKTEVLLLSKNQIISLEKDFAFTDHFQILSFYFDNIYKTPQN